jgi:4-carboxymuconolactone decarboxylase
LSLVIHIATGSPKLVDTTRPLSLMTAVERADGGSMRHGRIPWPTPAELDDDQREVHQAIVGGPRASAAPAFALQDEEGRLHGPFNSMLVAPQVGLPLQELGGALRYRTSLTDRERELAILALAVLRRSEFEWYAHERVGRRVGLTDEELALLADGETPAGLSPSEDVVLRTTRLLVGARDLDDAAYDEAVAVLGLTRVTELVTLVGYYDALALGLTVFRTPLPEGESSRFEGQAGR